MPEKAVLFMGVKDVNQPTSIQGTLSTCIIPIQFCLREQILVPRLYKNLKKKLIKHCIEPDIQGQPIEGFLLLHHSHN